MNKIEQLEHDLRMADITNGKVVRVLEKIEQILANESESHVAVSEIAAVLHDWREGTELLEEAQIVAEVQAGEIEPHQS
jgi:hypothetical protein